MSIANEITRLQNAKSAIKTSIEGKGVTVPSTTTLEGYSTLIDSIQTGGGTLTVKTATATMSAVGRTLEFSSLSAQPKYWFVRTTSQISSSGSTTYYYITDAFYDGTNIKGNSFRIGSTRRIYNVTSNISASYSNNTLTITGGSATGSSPGQFYNGNYELVYIY